MELKFNTDNNLIYIGNNENEKEAYVSFSIVDNSLLTIRHIYVDSKFRGQGISSKLLITLVNYAQENNFKIRSMCGYSSSWLAKHEEYSHLLA